MTPDQSLAWVAGLLEGEGYFGTINNRVAGRVYRYPRIGVNMTDSDVVHRIALLWDVSVYAMRPSGVSKKVSYRRTLIGDRAADWMRRLYPFMGRRRREQIDKALVEWDTRVSANQRRRQWSVEAARAKSRDKSGRFASTDPIAHGGDVLV